MRDDGAGQLGARTPLVSVFVPVRDVLPTLDQCIESLPTQTYRNLESMLVEAGSVDGSTERCDWWTNRNRRVHVSHQDGAGAAHARCVGLASCHGWCAWFLDFDDWVATELFHRQVELAESIPADFAVSASSHVYYDGIIVSRYKDVGAWGRLARAELSDRLRLPDIAKGQDYALAYAHLNGAERVVYDRPPRYYCRQTAGSLPSEMNTSRTATTEATHDIVDLVRAKYPLALSCAIDGQAIPSLVAYNGVLRSGQRRQWSGFLRSVERLVRAEGRGASAMVALSRARRVQLWLVADVSWLHRLSPSGCDAVHLRPAA